MGKAQALFNPSIDLLRSHFDQAAVEYADVKLNHLIALWEKPHDEKRKAAWLNWAHEHSKCLILRKVANDDSREEVVLFWGSHLGNRPADALRLFSKLAKRACEVFPDQTIYEPHFDQFRRVHPTSEACWLRTLFKLYGYAHVDTSMFWPYRWFDRADVLPYNESLFSLSVSACDDLAELGNGEEVDARETEKRTGKPKNPPTIPTPFKEPYKLWPKFRAEREAAGNKRPLIRLFAEWLRTRHGITLDAKRFASWLDGFNRKDRKR